MPHFPASLFFRHTWFLHSPVCERRDIEGMRNDLSLFFDRVYTAAENNCQWVMFTYCLVVVINAKNRKEVRVWLFIYKQVQTVFNMLL